MANENFCPKCGRSFTNFCVFCANENMVERTLTMMDEAGLTERALVGELAWHVFEGKSLGAVKLGMDTRGMRQPQKTETKVEVVDGDSQSRIADLVARFAGRRPTGGGDSET